MSTARLADRQIRGAALQAALRLDVRGPVSQALGQTGIVVPEEPESPASVAPSAESAPARRTVGRAKAAPRVVKPFQPAPWPTRRTPAEPEALAGLTADERRVHQILLDALVLNSESGLGDGTGTSGLSYLERKHLKALDLPFINAEIAKMDDRGSGSAKTFAALGLSWFGGILMAIGFTSTTAAATFIAASGALLLVLAAAVGVGLIPSSSVSHFGISAGAVAQRRKIYGALRELALLVDPGDAVSDALAEADRVIDRIAFSDAEPDRPSTDSLNGTRSRVRS